MFILIIYGKYLDNPDFFIIFVVEKNEVMFYIYEKNMNTNSVRVFTKVNDKSVAEHKVMEMNEDSLFDDKYYFIKEVND